MAQAELTELLKAICQSINEAQGYLDYYPLIEFSRYFSDNNPAGESKNLPDDGSNGDNGTFLYAEPNSDNEKNLRPKMIKFWLPKPKGGYIEKEIPIVSLVNHNAMDLDEVRIDLQVTGGWVCEPSDPQRKKLMVDIGPIRDKKEDDKSDQINYMSIEMIFKKECPPEGTARLLNEVNKFVL